MTIRKLFADVDDPEGPVAVGESTWIITEMGRGAITRLGPGADRTTLATTGRPNGLAIERDSTIWIAESRDRCLMRLDKDASEAEVVAAVASGEQLLWPNDLCIGPDGLIYLTDSGIEMDTFEALAPAQRLALHLDGRVVVVDPATGGARILDRGLQFANGIAIGPDAASLYVAETLTGLIHRYPLGNISAGTRQAFGQVLSRSPMAYDGIAGPDGMAFDADGVLLVAVLTQGTLTALSPDGDVLEHLALPDDFPTNLAFGGPDGRTVLVTGCASGALYGVDWRVPGLTLHDVVHRAEPSDSR